MITGLRVAVTGASGFCGAVVAGAAARAGAEVICLGRRPGPVGIHVPWDASVSAPDLAGADVVIHLAAAVGDPRRTDPDFWMVNVDGTERLLDAARSRPVVWVSSASVYDPRFDRGLVREDHPVGGQLSDYGRSKAVGERLAIAAGAVVLRPRAVYGTGDPHLLPRLLQAVRGRTALLPGPDVRLSLTAVENLADACLAAISWPGGAYNIADARPYWRDAAVRAMLDRHGHGQVRVRHVPIGLAAALARLGWAGLTPYAVDQAAHEVVLDIGKALAQGWRPRIALTDFLARPQIGGSSPAPDAMNKDSSRKATDARPHDR